MEVLRNNIKNFVYLCPQITEGMDTDITLEEEPMKPYTREELVEMAETGRKQIAEGKWFTTEEVLRHCGYQFPNDKMA